MDRCLDKPKSRQIKSKQEETEDESDDLNMDLLNATPDIIIDNVDISTDTDNIDTDDDVICSTPKNDKAENSYSQRTMRSRQTRAKSPKL